MPFRRSCRGLPGSPPTALRRTSRPTGPPTDAAVPSLIRERFVPMRVLRFPGVTAHSHELTHGFGWSVRLPWPLKRAAVRARLLLSGFVAGLQAPGGDDRVPGRRYAHAGNTPGNLRTALGHGSTTARELAADTLRRRGDHIGRKHYICPRFCSTGSPEVAARAGPIQEESGFCRGRPAARGHRRHGASWRGKGPWRAHPTH
jgi:hypothetical protein